MTKRWRKSWLTRTYHKGWDKIDLIPAGGYEDSGLTLFAAIVRLAGALLLEQNDEWQLQRWYMQLEGMNVVSDNQAARLSAVIS